MKVLIFVASITIAMTSGVHAQLFDGTWSGKEGCTSYLNMPSWNDIRVATIVHNHFRFVRNSDILYETTEGEIQADGTITITGRGVLRDNTSTTWSVQYSGKAFATTMSLIGTRTDGSVGRPCSMELNNTLPSPYSLASGIIAGQEVRQRQLDTTAEKAASEEAVSKAASEAASEAAAEEASEVEKPRKRISRKARKVAPKRSTFEREPSEKSLQLQLQLQQSRVEQLQLQLQQSRETTKQKEIDFENKAKESWHLVH